MNSDKNAHLSESELLALIAESAPRNENLNLHIEGCSRCLLKKKQLENELARLGQAAKTLSPAPKKAIQLPAPSNREPIWKNWAAKPAFAMALSLLIIIAVFTFRSGPPNTAKAPMLTSTGENETATQLMREIDMLVENALPASYFSISAENNPALDDDFMQFIIPPLEEDSLT